MTSCRARFLFATAVLAIAGTACAPTRPSISQKADAGAESLGSEFLLAAGARHTCAVFAEGAVRCWGDNSSGQLGRPSGADPLATYSVDLGVGRRAAKVFAGLDHSCVILEEGEVKCWGRNAFGSLGLGDESNRGDGTSAMGAALPEVDLGLGRRAVSLALGGSASCALLDDGLVKCWGDAYQGALGYGDIGTRGATAGSMGNNLPTVDLGSRAGVPLRARQVVAIDYHSFCAILAEGDADVSALKCWGSNDYCELGLGSREGSRGSEPETMGNHLAFVDLGTTLSGAKRKAIAIAGGWEFACVLGDDGAVKCWGENLSGQLGVGSVGLPRSCAQDELGNAGLVPLPEPAVAIGARGGRACARLASNDVVCWGDNVVGQLGTGDMQGRSSPSAPISFPVGFTPESLVLGKEHACAVSKDKRAACWGNNQQGQLPNSVAPSVLVPGPARRLRGRPVLALAAGADHTCAILIDGAVKCWGGNAEGQLGVGDRLNRGDQQDQMGDNLPVVDLGGRGAIATAAGVAHTCVVLDDGNVTCWGANGAGQLGSDASSGWAIPSPPVSGVVNAIGVAAGADFTCLLLTSGKVNCFGANDRGQLGLGDAGKRAGVAGDVALGSKAIALAVGDHHACAVLEHDRMACWGANEMGQLGVGDTADRLRPALLNIASVGAVGSVAARSNSTCVLLRDGRSKCWGGNASGQLALGDAIGRLAPPSEAINLGTGQTAAVLSMGDGFACALLSTHQGTCWGDNRKHQLGVLLEGAAYGDQPSETGDFLPEVFQGGGRSVRALATGSAHTCVLLDTADVRCWGDNSLGQLGIGDSREHSCSLNNSTGVVDLGVER